MTGDEIAAIAERISKTRDRDTRDARAMLRQLDQDHGRDVAQAVIARMQLLTGIRHDATMAVFRGLPSGTSFADAIRIKTARGDPCAQGWSRQRDGSYAKDVPLRAVR